VVVVSLGRYEFALWNDAHSTIGDSQLVKTQQLGECFSNIPAFEAFQKCLVSVSRDCFEKRADIGTYPACGGTTGRAAKIRFSPVIEE
jgi:hypothetical protein